MRRKDVGVFRRFLFERKGTVAMTMALLLPVIAAAGGGAMDFANAMSRNTSLQKALDSAALSTARSGDEDEASRKETAQKIFDLNFGQCENPIETILGDGIVEVSATCDVPTTLLKIVGMKGIEINGYAKAGYADAASGTPAPLDACVLTLKEERRTLNINGTTNITTDCGWHSNSTADDSLHYNGTGRFNMPSFSAVGGIGGINMNGMPDQVLEYTDAIPDPLAAMPPPAEVHDGCTHTGFSANGTAPVTLDPGVYCGGISINGADKATFNPGTYIIRDGRFLTNGVDLVEGNGILIYLEAEADITFNGASTIRLSALERGPHAGFLIMQASDTSAVGNEHAVFNMVGQSYIEGTLYLPHHSFVMNGVSTFNYGASYTKIIVRKFTLNGGGTLTMGSDYERRSPLPAGLQAVTQSRRVARLIE